MWSPIDIQSLRYTTYFPTSNSAQHPTSGLADRADYTHEARTEQSLYCYCQFHPGAIFRQYTDWNSYLSNINTKKQHGSLQAHLVTKSSRETVQHRMDSSQESCCLYQQDQTVQPMLGRWLQSFRLTEHKLWTRDQSLFRNADIRISFTWQISCLMWLNLPICKTALA